MSYEIIPPARGSHGQSGNDQSGHQHGGYQQPGSQQHRYQQHGYQQHGYQQSDYQGQSFGGPEVGDFSQRIGGNAASEWVLRQYLLTRALGRSIVRTVHWTGVLTLAVAVGIWFAGVHWLAILVGLLAFAILIFRALLSGIQNRLASAAQFGTASRQVDKMVAVTRRGLRAELRRVGLPSAPWGPTQIAMRLMRRTRRAQTLAALRKFDLTQVVPQSTLDELHLLLRGGNTIHPTGTSGSVGR
jgi:hypothetical protein